MSNEFNTIRIRFSKTGRAKYISHLDVNRTMTRALRRAHIPLWYTEGFNRHPYITFTAPLSLGFESECERMDLRLVEPMAMEDLCARLNAVMPDGMHVESAAPAVRKAGELGFARYRLQWGCEENAVREFLEQSQIIVQKKSKKGVVRDVDLKAALRETTVVEAEGKTVLEVTLPCSSGDTVNPMLLNEALQRFTGTAPFCTVRRLELYDADGRVFE